MARRILSADAALFPQSQQSLVSSQGIAARSFGAAATIPPAGTPANFAGPAVFAALQARWVEKPPGQSAEARPGATKQGAPKNSAALPAAASQRSTVLPDAALFDWDNRVALMEEIAFVNRAQGLLDEAAIKIAPSVLKIVLTVKRNLLDPSAQRAFLADHLALDFRRVSELCIVADSYALLDGANRAAGEQEIARYGWSKALKLAAVRDGHERRDLWRRACASSGAGAETAPYRAVLEEIRRYRERKQIAPPPAAALLGPGHEIGRAFGSARAAFIGLERSLVDGRAETRAECTSALREVTRLRKELDHLKAALQQRLEIFPVDEMADELAREA